MSDHYCCKNCGSQYSECDCAAKAKAKMGPTQPVNTPVWVRHSQSEVDSCLKAFADKTVDEATELLRTALTEASRMDKDLDGEPLPGERKTLVSSDFTRDGGLIFVVTVYRHEKPNEASKRLAIEARRAERLLQTRAKDLKIAATLAAKYPDLISVRTPE